MFYESIVHEIQNATSVDEVAKQIESCETPSWKAIRWLTENGEFFAVNDAHIDDMAFAETAILKKEGDEYFQIDSITVAWVRGTKCLKQILITTTQNPTIRSKTQLIINQAKNEKASFTCGCCGEWFKAKIAEQLKFDQDAGHGICPSCEKYYS